MGQGAADEESLGVADVLGDLDASPLVLSLYERSGRVPLGARSAVAAVLHGSEPALHEVGTDGRALDVTWAELNDRITQAAHYLQFRGVARGGLVGVRLENGIDHVAVTHAAWRLGATVVPIDPRLTESARRGIFEQLGAVTEIDESAVGAMERAGTQGVGPLYGLPDPYAILPTGGSTGRPKLVEQAGSLWGRFDAAPMELGRRYGIRMNQAQLVCAPLSHGFGFGYAHAFGLAYGHSLTLMRRFLADLVLRTIAERHIHYLPVVPTMMRRIADQPGFLEADLSSLEVVLHAAGPCAPELKRRWMDRVGAERVYEAYGATDISLTCTIRGDEWLKHPGSIGRPIDAEVRIVDDAGVVLGPGQTGEILIHPTGARRHPVVRGIASEDDGGFRSTKDRGYVDADGYLFVEGRADSAVSVGGNVIYLDAVEAVLLEHHAVRNASVVGVPDDDLGARVEAFVEVVPDADSGVQASILAWCDEHCGARMSRPSWNFGGGPRCDQAAITASF